MSTMGDVRANDQPYGDWDKPGRFDIDGVEWRACDPYPTWYRWEDSKLYTNPSKWADGLGDDLSKPIYALGKSIWIC